jgi:hypothetical protein
MNAGVALDRDALYYPFIHITDVNWLKAGDVPSAVEIQRRLGDPVSHVIEVSGTSL